MCVLRELQPRASAGGHNPQSGAAGSERCVWQEEGSTDSDLEEARTERFQDVPGILPLSTHWLSQKLS